MIFSFLFFVIDFIVLHITHYSLYALLYFTLYRSINTASIYYAITPFLLLTIEDFLLTDHIGPTCIYMIPVLYFLHASLNIFSNHPHALFTLSCLLGFISKSAVLYYGFGVHTCTAPQIAGNIVMILLFLIYTLQGRLGNRFYSE